MNRLIIICEGQTEQEFVKNILVNHFTELGVYIQPPLIQKSRGGIVKWSDLEKQIILHLKNDKEAFVTTFIDYYGIQKKHKFPKWSESYNITDIDKRIDFVENEMLNAIDSNLNSRFIPYIQLHEFEGLLFNKISDFERVIPPSDLVGLLELKRTIEQYPNPEMINDNKDTTPSYRLLRIINGYDKVIYGTILAETIGLERIRDKCPRFNKWIIKIEKLQ